MPFVLKGVQPAKELALSAAEAEMGGSSAAWFDALFRTHYPRVVAMLSRLTGDRAQAEEIASDAFYKLAEREAGRDEAPASWLYRVAINAGLDALRRNARAASMSKPLMWKACGPPRQTALWSGYFAGNAAYAYRRCWRR